MPGMKSVNRYLRDADSIVRNIQKTVLYNWFQQVWNEGKYEAIGDFLSEDLTGDFTLAQVNFGTFLVLHTESTTSTVLIIRSDKDISPGALFCSSLQ